MGLPLEPHWYRSLPPAALPALAVARVGDEGRLLLALGPAAQAEAASEVWRMARVALVGVAVAAGAHALPCAVAMGVAASGAAAVPDALIAVCTGCGSVVSAASCCCCCCPSGGCCSCAASKPP